MLAMCDRFAVIMKGGCPPGLDPARPRVEEIGLLMGGARRKAAGEEACMLLSAGTARRDLAAPPLYLTPLLAVGADAGGRRILFAAMGKNPVAGALHLLRRPDQRPLRLSELFVKATPLMLIAVGLALGFRANVWNIGAEGQLTIGALAGGGLALAGLLRRRASLAAAGHDASPACSAAWPGRRSRPS